MQCCWAYLGVVGDIVPILWLEAKVPGYYPQRNPGHIVLLEERVLAGEEYGRNQSEAPHVDRLRVRKSVQRACCCSLSSTFREDIFDRGVKGDSRRPPRTPNPLIVHLTVECGWPKRTSGERSSPGVSTSVSTGPSFTLQALPKSAILS